MAQILALQAEKTVSGKHSQESNLDEKDLVERMKSHDAALRNVAFREFVQQHSRKIFALAYQLCGNSDDADDLTQEVFVRALEALPKFQGASSLATWLHRIAVNLHIDYTRSGKYRYTAAWVEEAHDETPNAWFSAPLHSPETSTEALFQRENFERALAELPQQQRTVAMLRFAHEYSLEEIAQELGVTVGTVKTLIFRAVRSLREHLRLYAKDLNIAQKT